MDGPQPHLCGAKVMTRRYKGYFVQILFSRNPWALFEKMSRPSFFFFLCVLIIALLRVTEINDPKLSIHGEVVPAKISGVYQHSYCPQRRKSARTAFMFQGVNR